MIRVQTPYKWTQSYAEQCKMKQGTFAAADFGVQQEEAAIVEISLEGMASARRTAAAQLEEQTQTQAEEQTPIERMGEGTTVTARSIEKLVETVLGGGEVSAEEEQRLNEELPNLIQRRYAEMYHFRLQDERNESESEKQQKLLEEEMKNNILMHQNALKDMKQAIEKKQQEEAARQDAEDAQNADTVANKAAEAEMIEDSLDSYQQEISEETQDQELVKGNVSDGTEEAVVPDEQKAAARRKVLRYDAKNKGNLDEIDSQRLDESDEQRDYSRMLDDSYQQTMLVFENDDFDLRERVGAYQNFIEESKEIAVNREIAEYQKMYDFRAATDLQIKALSDTGVQTAAKVSEKVQNRRQNQAAVQDYMRGMGQTVVEQAAKKKRKTVTDDAKRTDRPEQTQQERVLNETS
ncbi:MAG: hypothetical protein K2L86_14320 [Lachnospiraceae bacterium]|nr:hypothetical protein [Lachnospiraceae bacterium]